MSLCIHCHLREKKQDYDWCERCIDWGHELRRKAEIREAIRRRAQGLSPAKRRLR